MATVSEVLSRSRGSAAAVAEVPTQCCMGAAESDWDAWSPEYLVADPTDPMPAVAARALGKVCLVSWRPYFGFVVIGHGCVSPWKKATLTHVACPSSLLLRVLQTRCSYSKCRFPFFFGNNSVVSSPATYRRVDVGLLYRI